MNESLKIAIVKYTIKKKRKIKQQLSKNNITGGDDDENTKSHNHLSTECRIWKRKTTRVKLENGSTQNIRRIIYEYKYNQKLSNLDTLQQLCPNDEYCIEPSHIQLTHKADKKKKKEKWIIMNHDDEEEEDDNQEVIECDHYELEEEKQQHKPKIINGFGSFVIGKNQTVIIQPCISIAINDCNKGSIVSTSAVETNGFHYHNH